MVRVTFTKNIQRHVSCPATEANGQSVREVLDAVFQSNDRARGYVLDERGAVRSHMVVFVNGVPVSDRTTLSQPVTSGDEIHIMQALSGG